VYCTPPHTHKAMHAHEPQSQPHWASVWVDWMLTVQWCGLAGARGCLFFCLFFCVGDTVILTLSSPRHCHRRHDTLVTPLSRSMPTRRVAHVSLTRSSAPVHLTTRVPLVPSPPPIFRFFLLFQEVEDEKCLDWAKGMNKRTLSVLGDPTKNPIHDRVCSTPLSPPCAYSLLSRLPISLSSTKYDS
jgi:hypothetical protein